MKPSVSPRTPELPAVLEGAAAPGLGRTALRVCCLFALAASAALTVEYRSLDPSFCGPESGCSVLRRSDIAYLWGKLPITLPELGLAAFLTLYALSFTRALRLTAGLALAGGAGALFLVAKQVFEIGVFCWLCMVVDLSAIAAALAGLWMLRGSEARAKAAGLGLLRSWAWVGLGLLALLAPAAWPVFKPAPDVPAAVRALYAPGKINVVEFADFECPFCRRLHGDLKALLAPYGSRVHFVRVNMPLDRHPQARGAALAAICAEASGKADLLVEFLFTTEALDPASIRAEVERLGIPLAAYDECLTSPAAHARLEREGRLIRDANFQGLPTTYIGSRRIVGAQSPEVFQDALERAPRGSEERGVPAWAYVSLVLAIAFAIIQSGRLGGARAGARAGV
jgi:protein-disulfide isomerase/uncharacterized membrane protein